MSPGTRVVATLLLAVVGLQLWLLIGHGQYGGAPRFSIVATVAIFASFPPVFRRFSALLDRIRQPKTQTRRFIALAIFPAATAILLWTGLYQHRDLFPKLHDESMHLLGMRLLSTGRLWTASHPVADSFEASHILVKPVYASIYFPGTAMAYVAAIWLRLPYWLMPVIVAGGCVSLLYWVTSALADSVDGLLAAVLLLSLTSFRYVSLMVISHSVMLLAGLLMVAVWLRWDRHRSAANALLVGAIAGFAAITRPVDALCYAIPIGIAMAVILLRGSPRRLAGAASVIIAGAAPFLLIQFVFNIGVTGRLLETPYRMYSDLFTPQMRLGFPVFDPLIRPETALPQKLVYYRDFTTGFLKNHRLDNLWPTWIHTRFPHIASDMLPSELLLLFVPLALLACDRRRIVVFATFALFVAFYACFPYLLVHYVVPFTPAAIFAVVLGSHTLADAFPRLRAWLMTLCTFAIIVLALYAFPQFNRLIADDTYRTPIMAFNHNLSLMVPDRSIVLFHFDLENDDANQEPVYNLDTVNPDDEPIIRAQDRSPAQNRKLFEYYARRQPDRRVYYVDRARVLVDPSYRPVELGRVSDLAARSSPVTAPSARRPL